MRRVLAATFFLLCTVTASVAAPAVDVSLALDEASVLPGTPTGLTVVVTNHTDHAITLPSALWLTATNAAGQTFPLRAYLTSSAVTILESDRVLPASAVREFRYDPTPVIVGSPWLTDDRLAQGEYHLRAVFAPFVATDGTFDPSSALVSNLATLTVAVESPDDAAVWEWMQQNGAGKWGDHAWIAPRADFPAFVMSRHPASHYALFAAPFLPLRDYGEPSPTLEEQARRFPNKSFSDQIKLLLIQYHEQALHTARRRADLFKAANESDAARALASELMRDSRSSTVRATAKAFFDRIPSREQLRGNAQLR